MGPETWLKNTQLLKLRSKLPTWTREDLLALAKQMFHSHDIDNKQLARLMAELKLPGLNKPLASFYGASQADQVEVGALRWVENGVWREDPSLAFKPAWFPADRRLMLRFGLWPQAAKWAFLLFEWDPRSTWAKLQVQWKQRTRLASFSPPECLPMFPFSAEGRKRLESRQRQDGLMLKPLPDSGDLRKRYYGLEEGERLPHEAGDRQLVVASVRVNLEAPPTITFREEATA